MKGGICLKRGDMFSDVFWKIMLSSRFWWFLFLKVQFGGRQVGMEPSGDCRGDGPQPACFASFGRPQ